MPIKRDCQYCQMVEKVKIPAVYDAKTKQGPWAYVCEHHFQTKCFPEQKGLHTLLAEVK